MGAPFRRWCIRIGVTIAAVVSAAAVLSAPAALWLRLTAVVAGGAAAVTIAYRVVPAFDPFGRVRWRLPNRSGSTKRCAITFDDGPTAATARVLDILAAEGVPATFFVLGNNVERHPDLVRRAQAEGHAIGLHGMTHAKLAMTDADGVAVQVTGVNAALERAGVMPAGVYRTPHGLKSPAVFAVARQRGLTLWAWSRGIWDTDRPDPHVLVRRATRLTRSGAVLLFHDGRGDDPQPDVSAMIAALPGILRELKRRGFAFVRLADV